MAQQIRTMARGDADPAVASLARFLTKYGYLLPSRRQPDALPPEDVFDGAIEEAVARYQRVHDLLETGVVDEETVRWMNTPRCGVADPQEPLRAFKHASRLARGFGSRQLRFGANLFSQVPAIGVDAVREAILFAFETWQNVGVLTFQEALPANIFIEFVSGDHGDGDPFDGQFNVLGHAFPPDDLRLPGHAHLDAAEHWSVDDPPSGNADLPTLLLHEIGHALGLDHVTADPNAVMHERVERGETRRVLQPIDEAQLQAIYP